MNEKVDIKAKTSLALDQTILRFPFPILNHLSINTVYLGSVANLME